MCCSGEAGAFETRPKRGNYCTINSRLIVSIRQEDTVSRLAVGQSKNPTDGVQATKLMSFTVFLGNLPTWVTADDIKQWLSAEDLVSDSVKVIRNHETQESKGFAFVEAPTQDEMQAIIRRFDRAPLEDKILRANPAQPTKGGPVSSKGGPVVARSDSARGGRGDRRSGSGGGATRKRDSEPKSAFATELAKAL